MRKSKKTVKTDSLSQQKELIKKMNDLRKNMKVTILNRVTNDQELSEMLAKSYNNFFGRTEDERGKNKKLLEDYHNAPPNQKEELFKKLPPNLQFEIQKSNITTFPLAQNVNAPQAVNQLQNDIQNLSQMVNDLIKIENSKKGQKGAVDDQKQQERHNELKDEINKLEINIQQKFNTIDVQIKDIPNSTDLDIKLAELKEKFGDLTNNIKKNQVTNQGIPGLRTILSSALSTSGNRKSDISFMRGELDPILGKDPILIMKINGNAFYFKEEDAITGNLVIYDNKNDKVIDGINSTPGLLRLLTNDNVREDQVNSLDIYHFYDIMQRLGYKISDRGLSPKKIVTFFLPFYNILDRGYKDGKHFQTLQNDINNQKLLDIDYFINERIEYIGNERNNPIFSQIQIQNQIDENLLRFYNLRRDLLKKLELIKNKYNVRYLDEVKDKVNEEENEYNNLKTKLGKGIKEKSTNNLNKLNGRGVKIYTSKKEVEHRLNLLQGSIEAGNNSKEIQHEIKSLKRILKN